jgi:hypothetical protein
MANYWPTATDEEIIAEGMNNLPKIVFSKTLERAFEKKELARREELWPERCACDGIRQGLAVRPRFYLVSKP